MPRHAGRRARPSPSRRPAVKLRAVASAWLEGLSRPAATALSLGLLLCVALGDALSGPDVSFTLLYLGPIGFATWYVSRRTGLFLTAVGALTSLGTDLASRTFPLAPQVLAWNGAVQAGVLVALCWLLDALKLRLESEVQLARTDPLTRVSNRRAFLEQAAVELERARRTSRPLTVAYLDADDFKAMNDRFGHREGDALLTLAASTLRSGTRAMDAVARLGGDEFGLLLVDADQPTAEALLGRLRGALAAAMTASGWKVSFSIGAVTFQTPPRSLDEMLGRADQLMYDAKRSGKDGLRVEVVGRPPPQPFGPVGQAMA